MSINKKEDILTFNQTENSLKIIYCKEEEIDYIDRILSQLPLDFEEEEIKEDSAIASFSAKFGEDRYAYIDVCTGQENAFINAFMTYKGQEDCLLEDNSYEIKGLFEFELDDKVYPVAIIQMEEK